MKYFSNSGIPSAKFVAKKGPVIMYNVDTAVLSIVAKVQELNAKGYLEADCK
jgi:hypothetical protein